MYFSEAMSDAQTLIDLLRELSSTRGGIVVVLMLGMLSGYGLLMLKDAVMGPDFSAAGGGHIDMKQKIFEEEESNLNTLRKKQWHRPNIHNRRKDNRSCSPGMFIGAA